jgi:hypothetical protein
MRSIALTPLLLAALPLTLAAQSAPIPATTSTTPPVGTAAKGSEKRVTIAGTASTGSITLSMRPSTDGFHEATLTAPSAPLYAVLTLAYADVGLTAKEIDQNAQQAGTGTFRAQYRLGKQRMSTFLDCGLDPMGLRQADSYAISLRVTTQILPEGENRSTVRTLVQATGRPPSNSGIENHCPSLGILEEKIAKAVAARAGAQ